MINEEMMTGFLGVIEMGAQIASIQHFTETMENQTSKDVTIDEVDVDKTMLNYNGMLESAAGDDDSLISVRLLNSTTVRLEVTTVVGTPIVSFTVIEYSGGIKNVQRGYPHMEEGFAQTLDVTIAEVDLSKTIVSNLGSKSNDTARHGCRFMCFLFDTTTLRLQKTLNMQYVSWEVIEFE